MCRAAAAATATLATALLEGRQLGCKLVASGSACRAAVAVVTTVTAVAGGSAAASQVVEQPVSLFDGLVLEVRVAGDEDAAHAARELAHARRRGYVPPLRVRTTATLATQALVAAHLFRAQFFFSRSPQWPGRGLPAASRSQGFKWEKKTPL